MNQTDKILIRRLYLQRYITQATNEITDALQPADMQIVKALQEFVTDADEKAIVALLQQRTSNAQVKALLDSIKTLIAEQGALTAGYFAEAMPLLIENEAKAIVKAMGEASLPNLSRVASLPVAGAAVNDTLSAVFSKHLVRVISSITTALDVRDIVKIFRGTKTEQFKDGLIYWRDNSLIKPNVNQIINGVATNADNRVYEAFKVQKVDFLATLDFRTCARCLAAEANSPYELGKAPQPGLHVNCRCSLTPHLGMSNERPYVKDSRSVKDIPKDERPGKIGQTRDGIESFFNRLSEADMREYLGKGRYELWKAGKINSLKDLVDSRTLRPLRLDELPQ